ncbi:MAG: dihydrolipoyl dehydrogenase [Lentisphaerae bacterium RIFOXYB12_FULL_65_16]|nr:MAG: dihydrolipoyl dehydrogenase [Lentisphaerae bacterium RIFOXYA12_64_32]OGV87010.1 MAG: dihydrolipoyl dehydrogenase [Lentisphaerae bacterium RIFOXYB12_FULL_65_16]
METQMTRFDLVVIGAGPGGYPAAFRAADLGMRVALVDPEPHPGGVCLYRGCIPSKALLHVAAFLHEVEQAPQWGISLGKPEIDLGKLREWKDSVVARLTGGLGQLAERRKITFIRGRARLAGPHHVSVRTVQGETTELVFEHALIATGSVPASIPGAIDSPKVMTSSQALALDEVPERLLVIGGGYIGLELGQVYASLGSRVTVVELMPEVLPGVDRGLVRFLEGRLAGQFESIRVKTKVVRMEEDRNGVSVSFSGQEVGRDTFSKVLLAVGRRPCAMEVGVENTKVSVNARGFIEVDAQRRTAEPSIFAVGDVAGEPMLAHKATHEGLVAAETMAGRRVAFEPQAIPAVVFSDPEVAWCGLMEDDARREGRKVRVTTMPWAASGRATTLARTDGVTRLVMDPTDGRILGVGIAGRNAGELLAEAVLAIEMGAVADDLALTVHAHPTLSETLMEAAQAFAGHSTHFLGNR